MEDDDDFGDLYTDVLSVTSIPTLANRKSPPAAVAGGGGGGTSSDEEEEKNIYGSSLPFASMQESVSIIRKRQVSAEDADPDWVLGREPASVDESESWVEDDEKAIVTRTSKDYVEGFFSEGGEARVLVKDDVEAASKILEVEKDALDGEGFLEKTPKFLDHDDEPIIPGLANPPILNSGILKTSESDDWDSGSEDDLQIVLNDTGNDLRGVERRDGGGSDEDDEDLVIVTDDDQRLQHQAVEEQDWSNDAIQSSADGEKKDMLEAKATNAAPTVANAGIGYSSHGFHLQHHSMFKYVRPGATPAPRSSPMVAAGALGQVRPPAFGSLTGRGRGDWKPVAGSGFPNAQKGFHSGYGLAWGSIAAGRPFGIGLDFSLPPHKTVFDIDIESFEEKPWRLPGVDLSDFFNFGLDEEHWKEYCKQLEQLRLESTMQGKIRVYESGRSEQDYDPDLPPELAAATGYNNMHADSINHGKPESRLADLSDQGSRNALMRPALPTGRAIQVESGFGERLPSIDTRPPRIRDSDAVIEIVLQDTVDDSKNWNSAFKRPESNFGRDNHNIFHDADEDDKPTNSEFYTLFPHSSNIQQRESVARTVPTSANGNEAIPPFHSDSSRTYSSSPKAWSPVDAARLFETQRSGRSFQRTSHRKNSNASECLSEPLQNRNVHLDKSEESNMQDANDEMEGNRASDSPPSVVARELTMEPKVAELDDKLALGDSHEGYGGKAYDIHVSTETVGDDGLINSANGQMLTSYIEQSGGRDNGAGDDDSRVTHSDNSQTRSGNSKDYQKTHEIGEVMMTHPLKPTGDLHKHREEADHRRRDDFGRDGRRDAGRHRSRGRESMHEFYAQKSWDSGSGHTIRGKSVGFERELNGTVGAWHRREDDIHYRQLKDEDIRRIHNEEIRPRERSKARMIERKEKSENHVKKQVDDRDDGLRDGDWRGQSRDVGVRHRERNDMLMNRRDTLEDGEVKRKRDAELARRDKSEKENSLHSYRAREDSRQKKRVRNDVDHRKREDDVRTKSKIEERQSSKHKDDNWHQRDREARQQVNFVHDDALSLQGREERRSSASRGGRSMEKMLPGTGRSKEDFKVATSEKDYHDNDRRRHNDQSKRGNRSREENEQFNKVRVNSHSQDKRLNVEQKSTRHEKLGALTDRPSAATSDGHELQKEKLRENKKVKDTEFLEVKVESNRRKHGGHTTHRTELSSKISSERQSNRPTADDKKAYGNAEEVEASLLLSAKHGNEDPVSDGESHESKRGRSKLERWTSHKERDYSIIDSNVQSSSIIREFEASQNEGSELANADATKDKYDNTETNADEVLQGTDKLGEGDRHLDTVAKLKMRSERFKLPMPREKDKDLSGNKKAEGEAPSPCTQNETASADVDIKLERPARKRKWTGS